MTIIMAQHAFHGASGLPTDTYVNTFHFERGSVVIDDTLGAGIDAALHTFYAHFSTLYAGTVSAQVQTTKIYDLADPKPRAPRFSSSVASGIETNDSHQNLPEEVALCLSYHAAPLSGVIAARRRGRIYLGPFNVTIMGSSGSGVTPPRPNASRVTDILTWIGAFRAAIFALGIDWVVYSPTSAGSTPGVASAGASIATVSVDNAFDTQRRRGIEATSREIVNLV